VSSTKIRNALLEGDVKTANNYLGEPFQLNGTVVSGKSIGKTLGYPTANLNIKCVNKIIPKNGVYLIRCSWRNQLFFGMMNIGNRPTFENSRESQISIEIHIFDFQNEIYGDDLQVELLAYVRDEHRFKSPDDLHKQLAADEAYCRNELSRFSLELFSL
jgi:riboflavin kinase / FMN adenylyltransferase